MPSHDFQFANSVFSTCKSKHWLFVNFFDFFLVCEHIHAGTYFSLKTKRRKKHGDDEEETLHLISSGNKEI